MSNPLEKFEKHCYESQHMTPREWGLLDVLLRVTHGGSRTLFFNGRTVAAWFKGASKTSVYRSIHRLESDGWLIPENGSGKKRSKNSERYEATRYRVLTHGEWTKKHGTRSCKAAGEPIPEAGMEPVPSMGMEASEPVPKLRRASPKTEGSQSQNRTEPVPYLGHSSVIDSSVKTNSVKTSPIGGESCFSEFSDSGQKGVGEAAQSEAASPKDGNGDHTLPTLAELLQKLTPENQGLWYRRTIGTSEVESRRIATEIFATQESKH